MADQKPTASKPATHAPDAAVAVSLPALTQLLAAVDAEDLDAAVAARALIQI